MTHSSDWLVLGFIGQGLFTARFLVQWAASEKRKASVVPVAFWWLSLAGGSALLAYAIHREDPVIILGQGMGLFVYLRNLMLVAKSERLELKRERREALARSNGNSRSLSGHRVDSPHQDDTRTASANGRLLRHTG